LRVVQEIEKRRPGSRSISARTSEVLPAPRARRSRRAAAAAGQAAKVQAFLFSHFQTSHPVGIALTTPTTVVAAARPRQQPGVGDAEVRRDYGHGPDHERRDDRRVEAGPRLRASST